jgi:hypothetical protein
VKPTIYKRVNMWIYNMLIVASENKRSIHMLILTGYMLHVLFITYVLKC